MRSHAGRQTLLEPHRQTVRDKNAYHIYTTNWKYVVDEPDRATCLEMWKTPTHHASSLPTTGFTATLQAEADNYTQYYLMIRVILAVNIVLDGSCVIFCPPQSSPPPWQSHAQIAMTRDWTRGGARSAPPRIQCVVMAIFAWFCHGGRLGRAKNYTTPVQDNIIVLSRVN